MQKLKSSLKRSIKDLWKIGLQKPFHIDMENPLKKPSEDDLGSMW